MRTFCSYCGAANTTGALACTACGSAIQLPTSASGAPSAEPATWQEESMPVQGPYSFPPELNQSPYARQQPPMPDPGTMPYAPGPYEQPQDSVRLPYAQQPFAPPPTVPNYGPAPNYGQAPYGQVPGQQPYAQAPTAPYAQVPNAPYGAPTNGYQPYGQQPYAQPVYGQAQPAYGQAPYPPPQYGPTPGYVQPPQAPGLQMLPPGYAPQPVPPGYGLQALPPPPGYGMPPYGMPVPYGTDMGLLHPSNLGGFGPRLGAALLDNVIMFVPLFVLLAITGAVGSTALAAIWLLALIGWPAAYLIGSWTTSGQTLGYKATGLRVVKEDGGKVSVGAGIVRCIGYGGLALLSVAFLLGFLGFLWMLWDDKKQMLHDKMASTVVVKA